MKPFLYLLITGIMILNLPVCKADISICRYTSDKKGMLISNSPSKLDNFIESNRQYFEENPGINGYRIQLHFSYGRTETRDIEAEFQKKYPDVPTYLVYEQPYFKLRVGDYRNLIEVQSFYYELLENFGNVFIVPAKIELPELKKD